MPNIASVLREEILRLSRKEHRSQNAATRKSAAQHRRDIAALKREVAALKRQVASLMKRGSVRAAASMDAAAVPGAKLRFVAKGLRSHRARLELSAGEFGKLVGVSAQSVYAWESGKTTPKRDQLAKIAAVRRMGKRDVMARLEQGSAEGKRTARRREGKAD